MRGFQKDLVGFTYQAFAAESYLEDQEQNLDETYLDGVHKEEALNPLPMSSDDRMKTVENEEMHDVVVGEDDPAPERLRKQEWLKLTKE